MKQYDIHQYHPQDDRLTEEDEALVRRFEQRQKQIKSGGSLVCIKYVFIIIYFIYIFLVLYILLFVFNSEYQT